MILGEFITLVKAQAGGSAHSPQEVKLAIGWALDALAAKAGDAAGPRMLYEFRLDLVANEGAYPLHKEVRTVKEVWNDTTTPPTGYSRIPYTAQSLIDDTAFYAPSVGAGDCGWWQVHRTIHIRPRPSSNAAAKLRVAAYARPPIPRLIEEELGIPWEAERWVIAKAAALLLPPPDRGSVESIAAQLTMLEADMEAWFWQHSASVPPAPLEDGVL